MTISQHNSSHHKLRSAIYGEAVADAMGVPYEFMQRGTYTPKPDMVGHGTHDQLPGTWSDDTSMTIATCDSIRELNGRIDVNDIRTRFVHWVTRGDYSPDGRCFDIGITVSRALAIGHGMGGERDNGNGSLMRIIPLAFLDVDDQTIREVSAITHAHEWSCQACVTYVHIARDLIAGTPVREAVNAHADEFAQARLWNIWELPESQIRSGGFVVDSLEAALWCLTTTDSYRACVMRAIALGDDTDTIAAIAGALAGIVYGIGDDASQIAVPAHAGPTEQRIPSAWIHKLRTKDAIDKTLW